MVRSDEPNICASSLAPRLRSPSVAGAQIGLRHVRDLEAVGRTHADVGRQFLGGHAHDGVDELKALVLRFAARKRHRVAELHGIGLARAQALQKFTALGGSLVKRTLPGVRRAMMSLRASSKLVTVPSDR